MSHLVTKPAVVRPKPRDFWICARCGDAYGVHGLYKRCFDGRRFKRREDRALAGEGK